MLQHIGDGRSSSLCRASPPTISPSNVTYIDPNCVLSGWSLYSVAPSLRPYFQCSAVATKSVNWMCMLCLRVQYFTAYAAGLALNSQTPQRLAILTTLGVLDHLQRLSFFAALGLFQSIVYSQAIFSTSLAVIAGILRILSALQPRIHIGSIPPLYPSTKAVLVVCTIKVPPHIHAAHLLLLMSAYSNSRLFCV